MSEKPIELFEVHSEADYIESMYSTEEMCIKQLETKFPLFSATFLPGGYFIIGGGSGSKSYGLPTGLIFGSLKRVVRSVCTDDKIPFRIDFSERKGIVVITKGESILLVRLDNVIRFIDGEEKSLKCKKIEIDYYTKIDPPFTIKKFSLSSDSQTISHISEENTIKLHRLPDKFSDKVESIGSINPILEIHDIKWVPKRSLLVITYNKNVFDIYNSKTPHQQVCRKVVNSDEVINNCEFIGHSVLALSVNKRSRKINECEGKIHFLDILTDFEDYNNGIKLKMRKSVNLGRKFNISKLCSSSNLLFAVTTDYNVFVLESTGKIVGKIKTLHQLPITNMSIDLSGTKVMTVGADKRMKISDFKIKNFRSFEFKRFTIFILCLSTIILLMSLLLENQRVRERFPIMDEIYSWCVAFGFSITKLWDKMNK